MATLADIAAVLHLNLTTVSKALSGSSDISQKTRERVLEEAARVGYVRQTSRKRVVGKNNTIGIICPEITSYYYAQVVTGICSRLEERGYSSLVALSNFSLEGEQKQIANLVRQKVTGIVIITVNSDLSGIIHSTPGAAHMPILIMGVNYEDKEHDLVSTDDQFGIKAIIDHLTSCGHQRIGFLGEQMASRRLQAFRDVMQQRYLLLREDWIILSDTRNEECGYLCMKALLAMEDRPTAVLAAYDAIAIGACRAISEAGLQIPEDIAVVGYDNANICSYLPRSLTSVNCDVSAECRIAVAILLNRIKDPGSSVQTTAIVPHLIIRESSTPVLPES